MAESSAVVPSKTALPSSDPPNLETENVNDDEPAVYGKALEAMLTTLGGFTEEYLDNLEEKLKELPELALLLPAEHKDAVTERLKKLRNSGIIVESVAETTYQSRPRVLWILGYDSQRGAQQAPASIVEEVAELIEGENILKDFHSPKDGPFALWPLHDHDVSVAIATCGSILDDEHSWWRNLLWTLRIMQPPGGDDLRTNLTRHYGREVCYCLMWDSLFTRSLWVMLLMILFFLMRGYSAPVGIDDCPEDEQIGSSCFRPFLFYFQMCMVFIWALVISIISSSRRAVLSLGGGQLHHEADGEAAQAGKVAAANTNTGSIEPDTEENQAGEAKLASALGKNNAGGGLTDLVSQPISHAGAAANASGKAAQGSPSNNKLKIVSKQLMIQSTCTETMAKMHSEIRVKRVNPEYVADSWRQGPLWKWTWRAIAFVTAVASLFFCFLVLSVFLSLKMYLIYEWGECLVKDCSNAEAKHGIPGLLADIGVDLLMAIIFMVLLGEVCKLVAVALVSLRNFESMADRRVTEDLVSLLIEGLGKVGFFYDSSFRVSTDMGT